MKNKEKIYTALLLAEKKARASKFSRLAHSPIRYPLLMGFQYILYPAFRRGYFIKTKTFFGVVMKTLLPSGTDIVLNGIKSHDSEIRLTKFLTYHLKDGDTFIDVGAHYGYYSLLASVMVGGQGNVYSVEASAHSFHILTENTSSFPNVKRYHHAAGDTAGEVVFYEYPGPFAEYNTTVKDAYLHQSWLKKITQTVNRVETLVLDHLIRENGISKAIIKIDTEGGEPAVIRGLVQSLEQTDLTVVMEYLSSANPFSPHKNAVEQLNKMGYQAHAITPEGNIELVSGVDQYLQKIGMDSDNLVFRREFQMPGH